MKNTQFLLRHVFKTLDVFERIWLLNNAPEVQKGLIQRKNQDSEDAMTIQGTFSHGVTPKLDKIEKDKLRESLKTAEYEKQTAGMGKIRKAIYSMMPRKTNVLPQIPYKERSLDQIICLKNIDIKVKKGSLTVIVGPTGSGKSSLLASMLGELVYLPKETIEEFGDHSRFLSDGELRYLEETLLSSDLTGTNPITINGSTGYCEQQPWVQNGKFRENVLFGSEFDKRKYVETIMACQLEPDLAIMTAGDQTEIGEKGINLSGGQKARVALARAIYNRPDILLMDDPISALDAHVREAVFKEVIVGLMRDKTRILATHAVEVLPLADEIIIMKDGCI